LCHIWLVNFKARRRVGLDVDLVDEEELRKMLAEFVDRLAVGRRLHVSGEDGAVDLVLPRHLREQVGRKIQYMDRVYA